MKNIELLSIYFKWFFSYEPVWLGPVLMMCGASLVFVWFIFSIKDSDKTTIAIAIISIVVSFPWWIQNRQAAIILLSLIGSWFQAVGTVCGYLRVKYYIRKIILVVKNNGPNSDGRQTDSFIKNSIPSGGLEWLVFQLTGILAVMISVWIGVGLIIVSEYNVPSVTKGVVVTWTLITTCSTVIGLGWRLWGIRESFDSTPMIGIIFLVSGSEVYNISIFGGRIFLFFLSKAVYLVSLLASISVLILVKYNNNSIS